MGNENIQIVVTAKDQASAQLKGLRGNIQALGTRSTGALGGMIGGFTGMLNPAVLAIGAITGVAAAIGAGAKSAIEEKEQLGRLDQALKSNVTNWQGNRAVIDKSIESGMRLAFADDALRESLIKLVPATKNESEALKLQQLAMDVARGRHIDLATATDIVIKANMGNVGALRRMGIELDKNATRTQILAALEKSYAGQAATFAASTEGRIDKSKIRWDEFLEGIGGTTSDVFGEMVLAADNFFSFMNTKINASSLPTFTKGTLTLAEFTAHSVEQAAEDLRAHTAELKAATDQAMVLGYVERVKKAMADAKEIYMKSARAVGGDLAGALKSSEDQVAEAMDTVTWAIKHPMKLTKELARIEGALTTLEYQRGLHEGEPGVVTVIDQQKAKLIGMWEDLTGTAYNKGVDIANSFESGLKTMAPPGWASSQLFRDFRAGERGERAAGGPVNAGGTYLVGEHGPELLTMGRSSGHITPNHGMGGTTVVNIDGRELFRIIDERMGKRLASSSSTAYVRG